MLHWTTRPCSPLLIIGSALSLLVAAPAFAQTSEVKIGLIAPMSGPWARQGDLMLKGAQLAVDDVNAGGGIKALGGAKLKLIVYDAGDSVEKAKNTAQRMVALEPDLIGATGAWLSSFTLGVTEVTERAEMPVLTLSYSDLITARGFKYVFQTSPTGGAQATGAVPALLKLAESATGKRPATAGIIMDNTAAAVSFAKPMREGGLEKLGVKLLVDEIFTPPLSDCTPLIQKARSARPDFLLLLPTAISDDKMCVEKINEFHLGGGVLPIISNGAHIGAPEMVKTIDKQVLEGLMTVVANWGSKGQEQIIDDFKKRTGEPWMTQELTFDLRRHLDFQGRTREGRRCRPPQGGRRDPRDGYDAGTGEIFPGRSHQVRRQRPPRRCGYRGGAMAERRSGHGLSGRLRHGETDLAEEVVRFGCAHMIAGGA